MNLLDNLWWTRKAKICMEKRLLSNAFHAQIILLWYSFFSVAISIYYLKYSQDGTASILWVIYSVSILCVSGFINGLSFKERANLIKECYENLKSIYIKAKHDELSDAALASEYEKALNACENHTIQDYAIALCQEYWSTKDPSQLTSTPTCYHKWIVFLYYTKRLSILFLFYLFPILILFLINSNLLN